MDELDFTGTTNRPSKSAIYEPGLARKFFESAGKPERVAQGAALFAENQKGDKMYFLEEGEISLVRGKKPVDIAKAGEIVGEMALVSQQPRNASAIARTPCRVIALDAARFQAGIQKTPEFALMLMNTMINRLRLTIARLTIGKALPEGDGWRERRVFDEKMLADLMAALHNRAPAHAPLNKVIMKQGEAGIFMYIVVEGRVGISIQSKVVERVGPGGVFGEMALVDQSPRAATAIAETDCDLLSLNRADFIELVKTNPAFGVSLLRAMAERMAFLTGQKK